MVAEIERSELDAWEVEDLSDGFEDRVMAAFDAAPSEAKRSRASIWIALAAAVVLGIAGALVVGQLQREDATSVVVELAGGARAWPGPGAHVSVDGSTVRQSAGKVIYEVPKGTPLTVATGAANVTVTGTRFEVEVMEMNESTRKKLMGAGALAMGTIAVGVLVYEGEVVLANERGEVSVAASQKAFATDATAPERVGERKAEPPTKVVRAEAPVDEERAKKKQRRDEMGVRIKQALESRTSSTRASDEEAAPSEELGTLDKEYIRDVVKTQVIELVQECYVNALQKDSQMAGRIVLEFEIMGDESVGGVIDQVLVKDESTLDDPEMRECVAESMGSAIFDPPEGGGTVRVTYPFNFEPE